MASKLILTEPVLGTNRQQFIERCQQAILTGEANSFIYLVATRALLDHITARIVDGQRVKACIELRVFLFDGLTRYILRQAGHDRRPIEDGMKYFLLEQVIARLAAAGTLQHIPAIARLPGTVESVGQVIGEIKRAGMTPQQLREFINTQQPEARDLDIAAIYEAYQQTLDECRLMDADEATAGALQVLQSRPDLPPGLAQTTTLFIDGFFDFTPIQKNLLRYLIERIPEVVVNLTYDPRHPTVFAEPLQDTFRFFERLSQPMPVEHNAATLPHAPALEPLRTGLFNPEAEASAASPPITVLSGASMAHEVEEVVKEIKRLIVEQGYRPQEIGVIVREPSGYLKAVHDTLRHFGVPVALNAREPLTSVPSVKAAMKVLAARVAYEETEPYLSLLKNDYLDHFSALDRDAVENAVLAVGTQIPIRQWRQRVKRIRAAKQHQASTLTSRLVDPEQVEQELFRINRGVTQLEHALQSLDQIRQALALIPQEGTLSELIQGWRAALGAFRLRERLRQRLAQAGLDEEALRLLSLDLRALETLHQTLEQIERLAETADNGRWGQLPIEQFYEMMSHLLQRTLLHTRRSDPVGVAILEATEARGLPFRAIFITGLAQGVFPMAPARDWIYPTNERQQLAEAGLFLEDLSPKTFAAKEAHFFYHAACQATERLYVSYPRADARGEAVVVSGFVSELRRLYGVGLESLVPVIERSPSVYDVRRSASPAELTRSVLAGLYQSGPDDALVLHLYNRAVAAGHVSSSVLTRLRSEEERQGSTFGPHDGLLTDPTIHQQLRSRFGPNRVYSVSQLNSYGRCPFQFFCQRILQLEEREEASLDLVALDRGWLLHTILHQFMQRHTDTNLSSSRRREYQEELLQVADDVFAYYEEKSLPIHAGLWALQKESLRDTLRRFLDVEIAYQEQVSAAGVQPHWLELGFGMTESDASHPDSRRECFRLNRGKDLIQLRGRMDRVDRSPDGKYIIYDYKSGAGASLKEMQAGVDLQIPLYIRALSDLFLAPDEEVIGGGYYSLKESHFNRNRGMYRHDFQSHTGIGPRANSNVTPEEWQQTLREAEAYAWKYVDGMRRGDFRVEPKDDACCPRCLYHAVCRFDKQRIRMKSTEQST